MFFFIVLVSRVIKRQVYFIQLFCRAVGFKREKPYAFYFVAENRYPQRVFVIRGKYIYDVAPYAVLKNLSYFQGLGVIIPGKYFVYCFYLEFFALFKGQKIFFCLLRA